MIRIAFAVWLVLALFLAPFLLAGCSGIGRDDTSGAKGLFERLDRHSGGSAE